MILKLLTLVCLCHHMRITPDRRVLKFVRRKYKIEIEMETGNDNSWTDDAFRIANERELRHQARQILKEKYIKLKVSQTSNEAAASF